MFGLSERYSPFSYGLNCRIKSTCCVKFDTTDQASETRMALNGVAWPSGNPKSLKVTFTSEGEMKKYQEVSH